MRIKKIKSLLIVFVSLFASLFLTACFGLFGGDYNDSFDEFEDALFVALIGNDPVNVNFNFYYPENYGLENAKVEIYQPTEEEIEQSYDALEEIRDQVAMFPNSALNEENRLSKKVIIDFLDHKIVYSGYYYYDTQLGSYLGYQAQLPLILAEYRFDRMKDVNDYFDYLITIQQEFENIIAFETEKANKGMGLTDVILDRCIDQCNDFLLSEENYLIPVFNDKIDKVTFLTSSEKETAKNKNRDIINQYFVPAYQYLKNQLENLKGRATTNGSLASFPDGKKYYEIKLQDAIGTNQSVQEIKNNLNTILMQLLTTYSDLSTNNSNAFNTWKDSNLMDSLTIPELIDYFQEKVNDSFPKLKHDLSYKIENINESLQDHTSPAMYFLSPIDDFKDESIYINPKEVLGNDNYTYQVLAHEGYPGHMYQHVYLKESDLPPIRKILNYNGYSEGWATYVEQYVVQYKYPDKDVQALFEADSALPYVLLGLGDIGVNYDGWSIEEFTSFIQTYLTLDDEACVELFYDLTEVPTNYLQYYYSYFLIKDLKEKFKAKMNENYSDLLFHTIFLETGPCSFNILEEVYNEYEEEK